LNFSYFNGLQSLDVQRPSEGAVDNSISQPNMACRESLSFPILLAFGTINLPLNILIIQTSIPPIILRFSISGIKNLQFHFLSHVPKSYSEGVRA
jgi:hypothetical protein